MTMPLSNKALQMDPHTSHLVGPVTIVVQRVNMVLQNAFTELLKKNKKILSILTYLEYTLNNA